MMSAASKPRRGGFAGPVWTVPLILAALTLFGLLSALLGQHGIWWALSWVALTIPLLVLVRYALRRSPSNASLADE